MDGLAVVNVRGEGMRLGWGTNGGAVGAGAGSARLARERVAHGVCDE